VDKIVTVHIPWSKKLDSLLEWNEITASIVEHFGLPGDRYVTELNENYMNFKFYNEKDGLMCKILVSEYI